MKYRSLRVIVPAFFCLLMLLTGCGRDTFTQSEATSSTYALGDVTGAGAFQYAGKYSHYSSYPTVSIWYDQEHVGKIIICVNKRDWDNMTSRPEHCGYYGIPSQVANLPGVSFASINEGIGQVTQTVWSYYPRGAESSSYMICSHDKNWLTGMIAEATECDPLSRPSQVSPSSILKTINSGKGVQAEEFWLNSDGTISECQLAKVTTGALSGLGIGDQKLGTVRTCAPMDIPTFPDGSHPHLSAINIDSDLPGESFWQNNQTDVLYLCKHDHKNNWSLDNMMNGKDTGDTLGPVQKDGCHYWVAPTKDSFSD